MRILFVHAGAELYGADRILLELVTGLVARGHGAVVVLPGAGPLVPLLEAAGAKVHIRSLGVLRRKYFSVGGLAGRLCRIVRASGWLRRLIRSESIDLVHTNTSVVFPGALAARLCRVPHVWHIHEITTRPRAVWRTLSWLVPRWSACVVCVSRAVADNLAAGSGANRRKTQVIYNGITRREPSPGARARVRAELGVDPQTVLVGMIGRVNRWKGQGAFVDAAQQLHDRGSPARFLAVGGTFAGEESLLEALRSRVSRLGLDGAVTVQDFRSDVADVLGALDVFVLPSIEPDPFPTVVLEAMGAGLPIVGFAHGGVREMIEDGISGTLAAAVDPAALADAIALYVNDAALRRAHGEAARRRLLGTFSTERFLGDFEALYRRLIRR